MKTKSLKIVRSILIVAIVGFALMALTGCGIGHGPYRNGYGGRNYHNADYYRSGYGYSGNPSATPEYSPGSRGYGPMMGYGPGRGGYCGW